MIRASNAATPPTMVARPMANAHALRDLPQRSRTSGESSATFPAVTPDGASSAARRRVTDSTSSAAPVTCNSTELSVPQRTMAPQPVQNRTPERRWRPQDGQTCSLCRFTVRRYLVRCGAASLACWLFPALFERGLSLRSPLEGGSSHVRNLICARICARDAAGHIETGETPTRDLDAAPPAHAAPWLVPISRETSEPLVISRRVCWPPAVGLQVGLDVPLYGDRHARTTDAPAECLPVDLGVAPGRGVRMPQITQPGVREQFAGAAAMHLRRAGEARGNLRRRGVTLVPLG